LARADRSNPIGRRQTDPVLSREEK
jgi:hypothetical protein